MRRIVFAACLSVVGLPQLFAQSVVLVSPSTQGQHSMACSADTLQSFEELHYLAAAHYLAENLCSRPRIEGAVGLWRGQAENSGMIDGCSNEKARELGALLGKYYHQKAALIFDRNAGGKASLVSFRSTQPLSIISTTMMRAQVSGATVIPHMHDNLVLMVTSDDEQRAKARHLSYLLRGRDLREEMGTAELMGDDDRAKARTIYDELLAHAPADVRKLDHAMYTEQFSDLGMEAEPPSPERSAALVLENR